MIAAFNALPRTADTTEGFFSRWVVVPFERFFPAGKADTGVIGRLTARSELRGLLRLAVGGLQNVMRRGAFTIPDSVRRATERFRAEADPIRGFIEERLESTSPNSNTLLPRTDVYAEYVVWSQMNGFHQMSAIRFYEQLMMAATDILPFPPRLIRKSDGRYYQGIEIRK